MAQDDLPLKLIFTRWYNSIREWILDDINQMLANTIVGGKLVGSKISGTIPSTSLPYSGATPADVAATAVVGTATSGAPHADHVHKLGILTTKGDVLTYGTAPQRRAVGTDTYVLTADSSQTDGVNWKPVSGTGSSTLAGDTDVSIVSPATSDALLYEGGDSKWHNVAGIFNVRAFGAVGDGVTNDTTAVQAAITAAHALTNGGAVYFPSGIYLCDSLTCYRSVSMVGDGMNVSEIRAHSAVTLLDFGTWTSATEHSGVLRDFRLNGNSSTGTIGLNVNGCIFWHMENVSVDHFSSTGAKLYGVLIGECRNVLFDSCPLGVDADQYSGVLGTYAPNEMTLIDCRMSNCTTYGVRWANGNGLHLIDCDIESNGTNGNGATGGVHYAPVANSVLGLHAEGCWFEANAGQADVVFGAAPVSSNHVSTITDCIFVESTNVTYGVYVDGGGQPSTVICRGLTFANTAATDELYANGASATLILRDCGGRSGGSGTISVRNGTVTSVAMTVPAELSVSGSPITTSGTLAVTKATQSANTVWAGPTSGSAAQPTFRALGLADLPSGTSGEQLVEDGVSNPPVTLQLEDGSDWLYEG